MSDEQVDIAIRSQSRLGITTRNRPSLNQNRLDPGSSQVVKDLFNFGLMDGSLQRQQTKSLMQELARWSVSQGCIPNGPPAKTGGAGIIEQRCRGFEVRKR